MALIDPKPVTLEGKLVRLAPLSLAHVDELAEVGLDSRIWEWNPRIVRSQSDIEAYVRMAVREAVAGLSVPFAIIDLASERAIGSSRFGNISREHGRLEIGWTWLAVQHWRTGTNTECKLLLLSHAFEDLGCSRVELKTDSMNARSRAAITRLGAKQEGILRKHILTESGRWRDTVYYSILDDEWPQVKSGLEAKRGKFS